MLMQNLLHTNYPIIVFSCQEKLDVQTKVEAAYSLADSLTESSLEARLFIYSTTSSF